MCEFKGDWFDFWQSKAKLELKQIRMWSSWEACEPSLLIRILINFLSKLLTNSNKMKASRSFSYIHCRNNFETYLDIMYLRIELSPTKPSRKVRKSFLNSFISLLSIFLRLRLSPNKFFLLHSRHITVKRFRPKCVVLSPGEKCLGNGMLGVLCYDRFKNRNRENSFSDSLATFGEGEFP